MSKKLAATPAPRSRSGRFPGLPRGASKDPGRWADVGLYMGYTGLSTFLAWAFGFALSGHLLDRYCPDPATLAPEVERLRQIAITTGGPLPAAYAHAHYIWYFFTAVGAGQSQE